MAGKVRSISFGFIWLRFMTLFLANGKVVRTRRSDGHNPGQPLLAANGLARLVDASVSGDPENHLHRTFPSLVAAAGTEANSDQGSRALPCPKVDQLSQTCLYIE